LRIQAAVVGAVVLLEVVLARVALTMVVALRTATPVLVELVW